MIIPHQINTYIADINTPWKYTWSEFDGLNVKQYLEASAFHLIGHLYLFMDYLTRSARDAGIIGSARLGELYVREAVELVDKNFQDDISIEDIVKALGLNRSYFGKIFRLATGKSPQSFLMNYSIIKAAELLTLTNLSIGKIGAEVGYPRQFNFSRAFRKIYSVSPREWRSQNAAPKSY